MFTRIENGNGMCILISIMLFASTALSSDMDIPSNYGVVQGQAYFRMFDEFVPAFSGVSIYTNGKYLGMFVEGGEYQILVPSGTHTLSIQDPPHCVVEREIIVGDGETIIQSFKLFGYSVFHEWITGTPHSASGYLVKSNHSPIENAVLVLPEFSITDTTGVNGEFEFEGFDHETELHISDVNGSEWITQTIYPAFQTQFIVIDTSLLQKGIEWGGIRGNERKLQPSVNH